MTQKGSFLQTIWNGKGEVIYGVLSGLIGLVLMTAVGTEEKE